MSARAIRRLAIAIAGGAFIVVFGIGTPTTSVQNSAGAQTDGQINTI